MSRNRCEHDPNVMFHSSTGSSFDSFFEPAARALKHTRHAHAHASMNPQLSLFYAYSSVNIHPSSNGSGISEWEVWKRSGEGVSVERAHGARYAMWLTDYLAHSGPWHCYIMPSPDGNPYSNPADMQRSRPVALTCPGAGYVTGVPFLRRNNQKVFILIRLSVHVIINYTSCHIQGRWSQSPLTSGERWGTSDHKWTALSIRVWTHRTHLRSDHFRPHPRVVWDTWSRSFPQCFPIHLFVCGHCHNINTYYFKWVKSFRVKLHCDIRSEVVTSDARWRHVVMPMCELMDFKLSACNRLTQDRCC